MGLSDKDKAKVVGPVTNLLGIAALFFLFKGDKEKSDAVIQVSQQFPVTVNDVAAGVAIIATAISEPFYRIVRVFKK